MTWWCGILWRQVSHLADSNRQGGKLAATARASVLARAPAAADTGLVTPLGLEVLAEEGDLPAQPAQLGHLAVVALADHERRAVLADPPQQLPGPVLAVEVPFVHPVGRGHEPPPAHPRGQVHLARGSDAQPLPGLDLQAGVQPRVRR